MNRLTNTLFATVADVNIVFLAVMSSLISDYFTPFVRACAL